MADVPAGPRVGPEDSPEIPPGPEVPSGPELPPGPEVSGDEAAGDAAGDRATDERLERAVAGGEATGRQVRDALETPPAEPPSDTLLPFAGRGGDPEPPFTTMPAPGEGGTDER
jgi:hypothetical protein